MQKVLSMIAQKIRHISSGRGKWFLVPVIMLVLWATECCRAADAEPQHFRTIGPGAELPSADSCAERVRRSAWEPRPENRDANHTVGKKGVDIDGADAAFNAKFAPRIDGDFTGTTDEIIQWASCKWGFDEDITRARAVQESFWRQSKESDVTSNDEACSKIGKTAPCPQSYGILQVKSTVHENTYPTSEKSTAFNVDYALAWLRACYEGAFNHWLPASYGPGDEWGCVGAWYSGKWRDSRALEYVQEVEKLLAQQAWEKSSFNEIVAGQ